jgi:hypothetical protein
MVTADLIDAQYGKAWKFNGSSKDALIGGTPSNFQAIDVSLTMIARSVPTIDSTYTNRVFSIDNVSSVYNHFSIGPAGGLYFRTASSTVPQIVGDVLGATNEWNHIATTIEDNDRRIYLDGLPNGEETGGGFNITDMSGIDRASFGSVAYSGNISFLESQISECRYRKSIISADWIKSEAQNLQDEGTFWGDWVVPTPPVTYEISGTATLNGTPVENAVVRCIKQSDNSIIDDVLTDEDGEYLFADLEELELYHVAIEYEADSIKYNAKSLWDISPIEVES